MSGQSAPAYELLTIELGNQTTERSYSATIRGKQDIDIYPQVTGALWQLHVSEGQSVKRGQVLFTIDPVPYRAAVQQASANVVAAQASLSTAQLNYDANKRLFDEQVISEIALRTAENALSTAKATLAQAQAALVNANNNLSYTSVKSPSDGVVGSLPLRAGALVGPTTMLTTVSDNAEMYVYFSIDENSLMDLTRRYGSSAEAVKALDSVQLRLNDGSLYAYKGRVESVSGVIDRATGSASLRAVFANPERLLSSGSSGNIILPEHHTGVVVIPQTAAFRLQDKVFAYKVVEGKATATPIVVGASAQDKYIVTSGLSQGDVIVAQGVGVLREGTPVQ